MLTVLHVSDLHRSHEEPVTNDELLASLLADRDRYLTEKTSIRKPNAVIASGDIIQGVDLGAKDADAEIRRQYEAAYAFLASLADEFADGDRSRVVVVPGNHDVDWNAALAALDEVPDAAYPEKLRTELARSASNYRWNWKTRRLFKVRGAAEYERRFDHFNAFYLRFYEGRVPPSPHPYCRLHELEGGAVAVAAFNSCQNNDCFSYVGTIPGEAIGAADLALRRKGRSSLRLGVWHHNVDGTPYSNDFLDPALVRSMVGLGFRVGLHGHQHKAASTAQTIHLAEQERMVVVSAGSLCAGSRELPPGFRRQYNILEFAEDLRSLRVHVRQNATGICFSPAHLADWGGTSFVDLAWAPAPNDLPVADERARRAIELGEAALGERNPGEAVSHLLPHFDVFAGSYQFGRQLLLTALVELKSWPQLVATFREPQTIDELVAVVDAQRRTDPSAARRQLDRHADRLELPQDLRQELIGRIEFAREIGP